MKLIVGLGNIGEKYEQTRHNLGFLVIELLLKDATSLKQSEWAEEKKFKGFVASFEWQPKTGKLEKVLLLKPTTYMNNSGESVKSVAECYKIPIEDIWVIHDELDLPLGSLKIRQGGSAAGHKGVQSVMDHMGSEKFWRFRMGIGISHAPSRSDGEKVHAIGRTKIHDVEEYVISNFTSKEHGEAKKLIKRTSEAIQTALEKDLHTAQNRFNSK